jgi:NAD(P)-dependent dehydrogenase (short-subunit alcohol dehydrogenase family)
VSGRFQDLVSLVTGTTGIAAAAALALAEEGGRVFVTSRTEDHVDALVAQHESIEGIAADLTQEEAVASVVRTVVGRLGRIDCVYNVAGISARRFGDGALHEMTLDGWNTAIAANATSQFLVCRAAIGQLLEQEPRDGGRRGSILNMSSVLARHPEPQFFASHGYAASKGAVEAFTRAIAAYYAPHGIRVNAIAAGLVATPMSERAQSDADVMALVAKRQPIAGGALSTDDLVGAALYLLGDESRMVTGQVLDVDAGWSLGG